MVPTVTAATAGSPHPADRCAWYLRVSTPRQKLEHQREHVARYCEQARLHVPADRRFEDKEKRHKSEKRHDFQRLLDIVKARQLDWILICSFDRWGVADVDEFFEFRRLLLRHDVQLWSVVDQMNLTGLTEGDYFRIVAMAVGATRYVEQMAEKNILKMIEMSKQGWAATGNAPFGTDLVCYQLHDLTRPLFRVVRTRYIRPHRYKVVHYTPESRVERDAAGFITDARLAVAREDETERMPPRDKKATGYRFEPTVEADRLRAVRLAYELYDTGLGFAEISRRLWEQGFQHYDKPFGYHGVESILLNPVYVGRPAWGKVGVGTYRILHGGGPARIRRKSSDTLVVRKDESQYAVPVRPVFAPLVPPDLWQRVHDRLKARTHTNPNYGKRRTRSRATHPLNGKLYCPDCDRPMVLGSTMPAVGGRGRKTRCFNCGTYRRFSRVKCHANTVGWDRLDAALAELLRTVRGRIDRLVADPVQTLREERWAKDCELTRVLALVGKETVETAEGPAAAALLRPADPSRGILDQVFEVYESMHAARSDGLRAELAGVEEELDRIGRLLLEGIPSQTVKRKLFDRMAELEERKRAVEPLLVPATARARDLMHQVEAVRRTIDQAEQAAMGRLLDTFVEKAVPRFEVEHVGPKRTRRTSLRSVEFVPRETAAATSILPQTMEFGASRRDTG